MACSNLSDYHIHTRFSTDSAESPENIIRTAVNLGLREICFTDHMDLDYPGTEEYPNPAFFLNTKDYFEELSALRQAYAGKLTIKIGMELGLMPYLASRNAVVARSADFDFIIGSTHLINGEDPYYPEYWEGKDADKVIDEYFCATYDNIQSFGDYDVYGHLDYITRYVTDKEYVFSYRNHSDIVDAILRGLIDSGHGIEINTSPFSKGFTSPNPCPDIIKRYRELGGEIITIGSDAHIAGNVGGSFSRARDILKECGFEYYAVYTRRRPEMLRL